LVYTSDALIKLLYDSKALSIWDRKKGPVFWYIVGVPGPFYINTEWMIGAALADELLGKIDAILAGSKEPATRAQQLDELILAAYAKTPVYRDIVATMVARAKENFPEGSYSFVSGGERRDWLFSIPFAHECKMPHAFLFKNLSVFCDRPLKPHESSLHIADLINNAASYFDLWFPALEKAQLRCAGTLCVNSRGAGMQRLEAHGQKAVALNAIELPFFKQSLTNGLISQDTYDEIDMHFESPRKWAVKYLIGNVALLDVENIDKKSFGRLQSFIARDPWNLRNDHQEFFDEMQAAIKDRPNREAS